MTTTLCLLLLPPPSLQGQDQTLAKRGLMLPPLLPLPLPLPPPPPSPAKRRWMGERHRETCF
jgi:hypothetical protein